ncbi:MAG: RNA polymerase sigma factor [Patescibacteria group bacterium]
MDNTREQFSNIYDQYIEKIYRFVYLKVNSQEIAEDITSKVFLKGWGAYMDKKEIRNPGAFLYQIAGNMVIDHYREKGRTKIVSAENIPQAIDPGANLQDMAILSSDVNAVKVAMQKLKKDYQDIIMWHYLDDMPIAEVAKIMDKPAGTIRVMLHRGLKELKDIIQES